MSGYDYKKDPMLKDLPGQIWYSPSLNQVFLGPAIPGDAVTYYPARRCIKAEDELAEMKRVEPDCERTQGGIHELVESV